MIVTVVDSMCGMGKTEAMLNMIKHDKLNGVEILQEQSQRMFYGQHLKTFIHTFRQKVSEKVIW